MRISQNVPQIFKVCAEEFIKYLFLLFQSYLVTTFIFMSSLSHVPEQLTLMRGLLKQFKVILQVLFLLTHTTL
jgi:hypothetical protein